MRVAGDLRRNGANCAWHPAAVKFGDRANIIQHRLPGHASTVNRTTPLTPRLQLLAMQGRIDGVIGDGLKEQVKRVTTIGEFIREQREQAQISLRQLAKLTGVSNPYISQIERGLRRPSAEILQQIAKGLRISAEQLYVQAGILDAREGNSETIAAILADPVLDERQKQALIQIYQSFHRETLLTESSRRSESVS